MQSSEEAQARWLRANDTTWLKLCSDNKLTQAQINSFLGARANGFELSEVRVCPCVHVLPHYMPALPLVL